MTIGCRWARAPAISSPGLAGRIFRHYGVRALETARTHPYQLAEDIHGVGFLTADRIARNLGVPVDSPDRLRAGLVHVLEEATGDGHVFLPRDRLLSETAELLGVPAEGLDGPLAALDARHGVVLVARQPGEPAVYLRTLERAEARVVKGLRRMLRAPVGPGGMDRRA